MVYTVFYKTSSFAGYCFLDKNSIHPKRYGVFSFKAFKAVLVKIQICSFIVYYKKCQSRPCSYCKFFSGRFTGGCSAGCYMGIVILQQIRIYETCIDHVAFFYIAICIITGQFYVFIIFYTNNILSSR